LESDLFLQAWEGVVGDVLDCWPEEGCRWMLPSFQMMISASLYMLRWFLVYAMVLGSSKLNFYEIKEQNFFFFK
jgi:hypothetical protein